MLQLGTVNEIVKHQPDNVDALEKKVRLENELKHHLSECEKCRNALKDE
jgi:predicted anti-sigma-YlaC factor YlaD